MAEQRPRPQYPPQSPRPAAGRPPGAPAPRRGRPGSAPPGPTRRITPEHRPATPEVAPGHRRSVATQAVEDASGKPDLTVNKVLAGAGAAATSAVFGSFFGATGTIVGAALGSVVTTVGATLYQRSLDHTRDRVLQRVRPPREGETVLAEPVDPLATIPLQREPGGVTPAMVAPAVEPAKPWFTRKRLIIPALTAVVAFVIGLLVITGFEWITGSPISGGDSGTSVGQVVSPATGEGEQQGGSADTTETVAPTTSEAPSGSGSGAEDGTGAEDPSATATPTPSSTSTTSTPGSGLGGLLGGGG